jgi:hypothetical protein
MIRERYAGMRVLATLFVVGSAVALAACNRSVPQKDFASVEEAAQALVAASRTDGTQALLEVLGQEAEPTVDSGDPVQDKNAREQFLRAYDAIHTFDASVAGVTTLEVGPDKWPFPFPLVERGGRWRFDTAAGTEEVLNRRVGANEFSAIQSCLAFVDAQREYYERNVQQDPLLQFAQKLISTEGKKDGLYWPTSGDEPLSPLGEQFAQARAEGYFLEGAPKGTPYHGYIFQLLTSQGSHASGGAYDYMVGDKMLGGFGLLAFPAEYGSSGVMSFIVNHDGVVFSRDLGAETHRLAKDLRTFDPDSTWTREAAIE